MLVCAYEKEKNSLFGKKITYKRKYRMLFVFVYGLLMALIEKRYLTYVIGFVIGLTYIFVRYKLKEIIGRDCLKTPHWL